MCARLEGKVALVTGSTSGIGRAIALEFARQRARVIVTGRRAELGAAVVATITQDGGDAEYVPLDVTDAAAVRALSQHVRDAYGTLDVLVNNAGDASLARASDGPISDTEEWLWDEMYRVFLKGTCLCSKYLMPLLEASGAGSIINMSSVQAVRGSGWDAYSMVKGGIVSLSRSMAVSCAAKHVRVNCICPGAVVVARTAQLFAERSPFLEAAQRQSLTRLGRPEDIAHCAVYLAADEAEYVTGSVFMIDGGWDARGRQRFPDLEDAAGH